MSKEAFFISLFSSRAIGDDGAIWAKEVYSKDLFCEDIHFRREWMSLEQIAKKSMLVNISDAIAMNAKPKAAMIGIVIPKHFGYRELEALAKGFEEAAKAYGVEIIGGDTTAGKALMISVSIVSTLGKKPLLRKNARVGDLVAYTGKLGDSYAQLTRLLRGGTLGTHKRFITPSLRAAFVEKAAKYLNAGMDISDGLSKDLSRLLKASGALGLHVTKRLPKRVLCSGEEYEMLVTFDPRRRRIIERIAQKTRTPITILGKVTRGRYACRCKEHHF
jgi:thiamine-monophosphate kinase